MSSVFVLISQLFLSDHLFHVSLAIWWHPYSLDPRKERDFSFNLSLTYMVYKLLAHREKNMFICLYFLFICNFWLGFWFISLYAYFSSTGVTERKFESHAGYRAVSVGQDWCTHSGVSGAPASHPCQCHSRGTQKCPH